MLAIFTTTSFDQDNIPKLIKEADRLKSPEKRAEVLILLSKHLQFLYDIRNSVKVLEEAAAIAASFKNKELEAVSLWQLAISHCLQTELETSYKIINTSIAYFQDVSNVLGLLHAQCSRSMILRMRGEHESAITLMNEVLRKAEFLNDKVLLSEVFLEISILNLTVRKYDKAEEYALRSLAIIEKNGNDYLLGKAFEIIAAATTSQGDYIRAIEFYFKEYDFYEQKNALFHLGTVCFSFTKVYHLLGDFDGGLEMISRARDFFSRAGASEHIKQSLLINESILLFSSDQLDKAYECIMSFGNSSENSELRWLDVFYAKFLLGYFYMKKKEFQTALQCYHECLSVSEQAQNRGYLSTVLYETGYCYFLNGDYTNALEYIQRSINYFKIQENYVELKRAYRILSEVYSKLNSVEEAFLALKQYYHFSEIINNPEKTTTAIKLLHAFTNNEQNDEVEELRKYNQELISELHLKESELQALALQLAKKSQIVNTLKDDIKEHSVTITDTQNFVQRSLDLLNDIENQNDWEHFTRHFTLQHPDFFTRLTKKSNKLSPIEQKVCALLKINLSNQEIADILFLSKRTVDTHRYNIRKKLALAPHVNIYEFINTI